MLTKYITIAACINSKCSSQWLSGRTPDCGARGPRFQVVVSVSTSRSRDVPMSRLEKKNCRLEILTSCRDLVSAGEANVSVSAQSQMSVSVSSFYVSCPSLPGSNLTAASRVITTVTAIYSLRHGL